MLLGFFYICSKNFKLQVGVALNGHLDANFKIVQVSSLAFVDFWDM